jgi:hypothetical protein
MYRAIAKNKRNTVFIILLFVLIIGGLGYAAGLIYNSLSITIIVLVVAIGYAAIQYFAASRLPPGDLDLGRPGDPEGRQSAALPHRREPRDHRRSADAEGVHHQRSGPERLRHGSRSAARLRRGDHWPARHHG